MTKHQQQFVDDDDEFDVDANGNVLADGEVLRIPLMLADGQSVDVPLRVGDDGRAHVRVPTLDAAQRIAIAQKATTGPLVYHKVPTVDASMWDATEQARQRWIADMSTAWKRHRPQGFIHDALPGSQADSRPPATTTNMSDSDKAYRDYCKRLEDGWKKNRPGARS